MKKETKRLPNGFEVDVTTHDTGTVVVETKKEGRVVELREFYNLEEADKFVAGLVRIGEEPDLKKREERFQKMGLTEAESVVAARDNEPR